MVREQTGRSTFATSRKLLKALQEMGIVQGKMKELDSIASQTHFSNLEEKLVMKAFKFGVLLMKDGQTDENEMFSNEHGSQDYEDFLKFLGEKIQLEGWNKYTGGLDVKRKKLKSFSSSSFAPPSSFHIPNPSQPSSSPFLFHSPSYSKAIPLALTPSIQRRMDFPSCSTCRRCFPIPLPTNNNWRERDILETIS
jgi:hypothetical protein